MLASRKEASADISGNASEGRHNELLIAAVEELGADDR